MSDPREGFVHYLENLFGIQAGDRGFNDFLSRRFPANADATSTTAPNAWRRHLYLMLDAYRAERAHPIPEPPMTEEQLYDAMVPLSRAD